MRFLVLLLAALACAAPGMSQVRETEDISIEAIASEMDGFGAWLVRANEIQMPLVNALSGLGARWRDATAVGDPAARSAAFRPVITEIETLITNTNDQLNSLPTPEFANLDLPPDLQPTNLIRETRRLNEQFRSVIRAFEPLLEAITREDVAGAQRAASEMINALKLAFQSRILLTRAALAATPREDAAWEMQNVELLFFTAGARILSGWPADSIADSDLSLSRDLRALASQLDQTATEGAEKLELDLAFFGEELAIAERDGDSARTAVLRRIVSVFEVDRAVYPLARELADTLRTHAAQVEDGHITVARTQRVFFALQRIRRRLDVVATEEAAALAGAR